MHKIELIKKYASYYNVDSIMKTKPVTISLPKLMVDYETHISRRFHPVHIFKHREPDYYMDKPVTIIDELFSFKKGDGTRIIKKIVRESLKNNTEGRVALLASNVNYKKGHPMGFYYKLGFRSINEKYNQICEQWLKRGGKLDDRPIEIKVGLFTTPEMYLPKENIEHCLKYPEKILHLSFNA